MISKQDEESGRGLDIVLAGHGSFPNHSGAYVPVWNQADADFYDDIILLQPSAHEIASRGNQTYQVPQIPIGLEHQI